jgi:F-type H+-transporting ATPase subunit delta
MKVTPKQYAEALLESLENVSAKDQDLVVNNFAQVLADNNDLRLFEQIAEEFHKLELKKKNVQLVELTSARPLSRENERDILDKLNKMVKGDIELKKKIDEKLIGGVVIRMEDKIIDASTKNSLEQLKNNLTE